MGKHLNPRTTTRCERCGRAIGSQQVSHFIACGHTPKPADLVAIYLSSQSISLVDLGDQYGVSPHFIRSHLLHAGVTEEAILERPYELATAKRNWTVRPLHSVRCRCCEILIYKDRPVGDIQRDCSGMCSDCAGVGVKRVTEFDVVAMVGW